MIVIRQTARASLKAGAWAPRWLLYAAAIALALMALWLIGGENDLVLLAMAWVTLAGAVFLLARTARAPTIDEKRSRRPPRSGRWHP